MRFLSFVFCCAALALSVHASAADKPGTGHYLVNHAPVCDIESWRPWWSPQRITGYFKAKGDWTSVGWEGRTPRFYYLDSAGTFQLDNPAGAGAPVWQDVTANLDSGSPSFVTGSYANGFSKFSFALTLPLQPSQSGWLMVQLEGEGSTGIEQTSFIAGRVAVRERPAYIFFPPIKLVWSPGGGLILAPESAIVLPGGGRPGGNVVPITVHNRARAYRRVMSHFDTNDVFSTWTPRPDSKPKYWQKSSATPAPGTGWSACPAFRPESQPMGYPRRWNVDFDTSYDSGVYALYCFENVRIDGRYWQQFSGLVRPIP